MKVSNVDKIHMRVHGTFRGCLCHPTTATSVYTADCLKPDDLTGSRWAGNRQHINTEHKIQRTKDLTKVTCPDCLMLWDAWLMSLSSETPPRPHRDQILELINEIKEKGE